jgi:hypothetical protein
LKGYDASAANICKAIAINVRLAVVCVAILCSAGLGPSFTRMNDKNGWLQDVC